MRRDFLVLVSPLARTDRHTATLAGRGGTLAGSPKSTCSHRSARASSVRTPVHSDSITYAWVRGPAACAAAVTAVACASVMLRLGRPSRPGGVPVSAETFRSTRFLACALVIARVSARCAIATVALLRVAASAASALVDVGDVQVPQPHMADHHQQRLEDVLILRTVFGSRPGRPPVSQSSQHRRTV